MVGIDFIDGRAMTDNGTGFQGQRFELKKPRTVECTVRNAGQKNVKITVQFDGKTVIDWTGACSRLSSKPTGREPLPGKEHFILLQSNRCPFAVSKLELRPLESTAVPTR